jgi:hypothetical protein
LEAARTLTPQAPLQFRIRGRFPEIDEDGGRWLDGAPIIADGRVLLTPRDSTELHCVDLLDGRLVWKRPRGQGLYVAGVTGDRVVIVGRNQLEAYRLDDGEPAWPQPVSIPAPAGRGLLLDGRYVLPLSTGEIATLELATGELLARSRLPAGLLPGNLAAGHGALVSQSLRDLIGFLSERDIETEIAQRLQADPQDPRTLSWRGELRLHRGELEAGLADLRTSQRLQPDAQTSLALAGALLQGLRTHFEQYRGTVDELDRLTLDRQQRHEFLRLFAEGLTREGRRLEALQQYLRLAESAGDSPLLERADDLLTARSDRVIQGRVQALFQTASPTERAELDAEIARRVESAALDVDRHVLRYFGRHPATEPVRQRVLADDLEHNPAAAERALLGLASQPDPRLAGPACAQLAKLFVGQTSPQAAKPWLHRLATDFADVPVLNAKTGRELLAEWKIDEAAATAVEGWPAGEVDVERKTKLPAVRRIRTAEVVGSAGPRFAGWSFEFIDDQEQLLVARDAAGRARWGAVIPSDADEARVRYAMQIATPQVFVAGPWVALSLGTKFAVWEVPVGVGVHDPKFCFQQVLTPSSVVGFSGLTLRPEVLPNGRRRIGPMDGSGATEMPGQLIGLTADSVLYQVGTRLLAADPATGSVLWVRQSVPRSIEATADEQFVTLFDLAAGQARVYRTVDGVEVAQRAVNPPDEWLWFRGDRLLTFTRTDQRQQLTLQSLATGETLWRRDVGLLVRCRVVDDADLLLLDPIGRLQNWSLADARERWTAELWELPAIDYLWARRVGDRYDLAIRQRTPQTDTRRVRAFDINQIEFTGRAAAVDAQTGRALWQSEEIGPTAFDVIQPANSPILAFAARVDPPPRLARNDAPPLPGLSATFLDARTGAVLYQTWETISPSIYQIEMNGDRGQVAVNFLSWMLDLRWPKADVKPEPATATDK